MAESPRLKRSITCWNRVARSIQCLNQGVSVRDSAAWFMAYVPLGESRLVRDPPRASIGTVVRRLAGLGSCPPTHVKDFSPGQAVIMRPPRIMG